MSLTSLLRLIPACLTSLGMLSCSAREPSWQTMELPGIGFARINHPHQLVPADQGHLTATARELLEWTRNKQWDPLRVEVDATHPLVVKIRSGRLLVIEPKDKSLPVIWLSLEKDHRTLLEEVASGTLSACMPPPGKKPPVAWLQD